MTSNSNISNINAHTKNYASIKEDAELQIKLINKYIKVHLIKNVSYTGFVHSIDPISHSVILSAPQGNKYFTIFIPGHAILGFVEEEPSADARPPQRRLTIGDTNQDLTKRKNDLISWFELNLLPVSELEGKIIIGNVSLLPPYNVTDLCTDNPIVAIEIKKIMERMPDSAK